MKTVVVTGATSGIGYAVCGELCSRGYGIIGVGHSEKNCQDALEKLQQRFPEASMVFFCGDLMQQREVRRVSLAMKNHIDSTCGGHLYALINNAGCVRSWYSTTEDGYEQQFALNHLAGFLMTQILLPCLIHGSAEGGGRVIMTSSGSHKGISIHWNDPMLRKKYHPLIAYKQSKLCNLLFAFTLNERFAKLGIHAYAVDPGLVKTDIGNKQTGSLVSYIWSLRKRHGVLPEIPAKTYAWLCDQEPVPTGLYYYQCKESAYSRQVNQANALRLFNMSRQLCELPNGRY